MAREKPRFIPLLMQFTAFGPGVVTNTTQNRAKMIHASKLMAFPLIGGQVHRPRR